MKRYHEERALAEKRMRAYERLNGIFGDHPICKAPPTGYFRKTRRSGGCCSSRCSLCHPDKFPKRQPTLQERKAALEDE